MIPEPGIYLQGYSTGSNGSEAAVRLLGEVFGSEVVVGHHHSGAPFLPHHPEWSLSISHSADTIAVALWDGTSIRLGVDVEEKWWQAERLLPRFSSENERTLLQELSLAPLHLWCAKEAVYKGYSDLVTRFTKDIVLVGGSEGRLLLEVRSCTNEREVVQVKFALLKNGGLLAYTAPGAMQIYWR